ncbi:lipocalin-like domain-containing protein [Streptomyces sp. NPDC091212]|uniref:lipocalin-like domain-containing protein n=1 Tax=Streptomyces sp. NPDC091212 TaxID=3155191 RepID=UPI0034305D50
MSAPGTTGETRAATTTTTAPTTTPAPSGAELAGLWRLVAYFDIDDEGTTSEGPLGPEPRGLLFYSADGYMSVDMMRPGPPGPAVGYMGYAGGWRVSGNQLVHMIEVCSNPLWADTEQIRDVTLDGDRLVLSGSAVVSGQPQRRVLHWERARIAGELPLRDRTPPPR